MWNEAEVEVEGTGHTEGDLVLEAAEGRWGTAGARSSCRAGAEWTCSRVCAAKRRQRKPQRYGTDKECVDPYRECEPPGREPADDDERDRGDDEGSQRAAELLVHELAPVDASSS